MLNSKKHTNSKPSKKDINQARPSVSQNLRSTKIKKNNINFSNHKTKNTKSFTQKSKSAQITDEKITNKTSTQFLNGKTTKKKLYISRRKFIYGAIGAGILAVGASGIKFASDKIGQSSNTINTLDVQNSSVLNSQELTENELSYLNIKDEYTFPYGTLAWANNSNIITCLVPTDKAKPIVNIDIINIETNKRIKILESSIGLKQGYEIYDARSNDKGIIWTEINILQNEWRIYCSSLQNDYSIKEFLVDKGNSEWETPSIAISGNDAYWQVLPKKNGKYKRMSSFLKKISFSELNSNNLMTDKIENEDDIKNNSLVIYTSNGRMATPIYSYNNGVIISPRLNNTNIYYQLTYIDKNNNIVDTVTLPQNMKPIEAGYGNTGFTFALNVIYNYANGISNLGTYAPIDSAIKENYNNVNWLNFSRIPSSSPAWCDNLLIIKSTLSVCVIDLPNKCYSILERPNASDDYGDYLASSGNCKNIVTYANVYDKPISGEEKKYCCLRIWEKG